MKKLIITVLALLLAAGCSTPAANSEPEKPAEGIDYLVLVNKLHPLPEDWEAKLETVKVTNQLGNEVEVEKTAYEAYLKLQEDLAKDNVFIDLDSVRRTVAEQQEIVDDFTKEYGAEYTAKIVAKPGYSEHHTGLALDVYLIIDGEAVYDNDAMLQHPEIWEKVHSRMPDYGFILRYLPGKEYITGYAYEPWHLRYVGVDTAREISDKGITLEAYLGAVNETDVRIDYGTSELYTPEEREEMAILIKCRFAAMEGCELHSLRYAGDESASAENLAWINDLKEDDPEYVKVACFLMDFHSPKENSGSFNPDQEYTEYSWWLGCDADGDWDIVSYGY